MSVSLEQKLGMSLDDLIAQQSKRGKDREAPSSQRKGSILRASKKSLDGQRARKGIVNNSDASKKSSFRRGGRGGHAREGRRGRGVPAVAINQQLVQEMRIKDPKEAEQLLKASRVLQQRAERVLKASGGLKKAKSSRGGLAVRSDQSGMGQRKRTLRSRGSTGRGGAVVDELTFVKPSSPPPDPSMGLLRDDPRRDPGAISARGKQW